MGVGRVTATAFQQGPDLVAAVSGNMYGFGVTRISIVGPAGSSAFAYVGSMSPAGQFDNTRTGELDTADYNIPVDVPPGSNVYVVWPNSTGYAYATVSWQTRDKV